MAERNRVKDEISLVDEMRLEIYRLKLQRDRFRQSIEDALFCQLPEDGRAAKILRRALRR